MKSLVLAATAVLLLASSAKADFSDGDWGCTVSSYSGGTPILTSGSIATSADGVIHLSASSNYKWDNAGAWTGLDGSDAISVYSAADAMTVTATTADLANLHFHADVSYTGASPVDSTSGIAWPIAFVRVGCMNADQTDFVTQDYTILASGDYDIPVADGPVTVEFQSYSQLPADQWFVPGGAFLDVTTDLAVSNVSFTATPEPATMALLCVGVIGLLRRRTR